jgi:hypothetical protein
VPIVSASFRQGITMDNSGCRDASAVLLRRAVGKDSSGSSDINLLRSMTGL